MKKWYICYLYHGNTYKNKYVYAETASQAIKKARVKHIEEMYVVNEQGKRIY